MIYHDMSFHEINETYQKLERIMQQVDEHRNYKRANMGMQRLLGGFTSL